MKLPAWLSRTRSFLESGTALLSSSFCSDNFLGSKLFLFLKIKESSYLSNVEGLWTFLMLKIFDFFSRLSNNLLRFCLIARRLRISGASVFGGSKYELNSESRPSSWAKVCELRVEYSTKGCLNRGSVWTKYSATYFIPNIRAALFTKLDLEVSKSLFL